MSKKKILNNVTVKLQLKFYYGYMWWSSSAIVAQLKKKPFWEKFNGLNQRDISSLLNNIYLILKCFLNQKMGVEKVRIDFRFEF